MLDGETSIRIHGRSVPIKARIGQIYGFSAHADYEGVNRWLSSVENPPQRTFCVHGEESGLHAMKERLAARGWPAHVSDDMEMVEL
jgi:metallo-beta-lactamase family protein